MIRWLNNNEERRSVRLNLFHDDVFAIAHKALSAYPCKMSVEEIFCTADNVVHHLLTHELTDADFIDYEIDEFERDLHDEQASFLVLSIAFVKLCALRKVKPIAGDMARALVRRLQKCEAFQDLLNKLSDAEDKRLVEGKRIDLMKYELKTLSQEEGVRDEQINQFVNATLECSPNVIESTIVSFTTFNHNMNHKYNMQLDVLTQGYKDKQIGKAVKKIEYTFNKPVGTFVAQADSVTLKSENHE